MNSSGQIESLIKKATERDQDDIRKLPREVNLIESNNLKQWSLSHIIVWAVNILVKCVLLLNPFLEAVLWLLRCSIKMPTLPLLQDFSRQFRNKHQRSPSNEQTKGDLGLRIRQIREFSLAGKQLEFRLKEIVSWPSLWFSVLSEPVPQLPRARANHFKMYNSMIRVMNDVSLGVILGILLLVYETRVINLFHQTAEDLNEQVLSRGIDWLMGWPAGFKLNDQLDLFLGRLFLLFVGRWAVVLRFIRPMELIFLRLIALSGLFGVSVLVSLVADVTSLMTFQVYCFYLVSARIYLFQLSVLSSLWKLFRGKKRNVLKKRIDSQDYDIDQLLLGTLIFTVLFFLWPTVTVYYVMFVLVRLLTNSLPLVILCGFLLFLNHFPLYSLALYFYRPSSLPGGIRFQVYRKDSSPQPSPSPPATTSGSSDLQKNKKSKSRIPLPPLPPPTPNTKLESSGGALPFGFGMNPLSTSGFPHHKRHLSSSGADLMQKSPTSTTLLATPPSATIGSWATQDIYSLSRQRMHPSPYQQLIPSFPQGLCTASLSLHNRPIELTRLFKELQEKTLLLLFDYPNVSLAGTFSSFIDSLLSGKPF
eukprot:TRINITY_DN1613_c0_g1_i4.p1 TRINITY_DN1613_c0_g1~~TRINITY_DN1613_c0_g1_i4.p1  ORF type:complete len:589 (-),score=133.60 TRINITY_DN1613_c0_g1_i4:54-1820(-)